MKRKIIMAAPPKAPAEKQYTVTAQMQEKYLILNQWEKNKLKWRHATDTETGEYETFHAEKGSWSRESLKAVTIGAYEWYYTPAEEEYPLSNDDKELIMAHTPESWKGKIYARIVRMEEDYGREKRETAEWRRKERVAKLMSLLPNPSREMYEWIAERAVGDLHYAIYDKEKDCYHCTSCQGDFTEKEAGQKIKSGMTICCPICGASLTAEKRRRQIATRTGMTWIHNVDEKQGVERHFRVVITWDTERHVELDETIRLFFLRNHPKYYFRIFYKQWGGWEERNPQNKRWRTAYLYPDGIREGMEGTDYADWIRTFSQMAAAGICADYNHLLMDNEPDAIRTVEYLFKGRFYRLLREASEERISYLRFGGYREIILDIKGQTIEEVMRIRDRQKIHRLREKDGGIRMLRWLQWEDRHGKKISDAVIKWYEEINISAREYEDSRAAGYLTPEQLMNYLIRRQREEWKGRKISTLFEFYEDYLSMASQLGKNLSDEMVLRPRELKRRHGEAVEESRKRQEMLRLKREKEEAKKQAESMRQKYPGSEEILKEIRKKYGYEDEVYRIVVPKNFLEIIMEGAALHHCVGYTERYFDRILQRETYICFLRKLTEPDKPFYTIEVEPGGTIRQHRGHLDEEPDIEEIKPFLRKWQKEIRKRMSRKDHEDAAVSAVKREQNMEELRQKNNTRVIEGLLEDLMEVI